MRFEKLLTKYQEKYPLLPVGVRSHVPDFDLREVAFQKNKVKLQGFAIFVEIAFHHKRCYFVCVEHSTNQFQTIHLWKKQFQTVFLQTYDEVRRAKKQEKQIIIGGESIQHSNNKAPRKSKSPKKNVSSMKL